MESTKGCAWAVRPYPHDKYRMPQFLKDNMVAVGWPAIGDLTGCNRKKIGELLREHYYQKTAARSLGQAVGIIDRFVNQIKTGHLIVVPDGGDVYLGQVLSGYEFHPDLQTDEMAYPHWVKVKWLFAGVPIDRSQLSASLYDSLKARLTVFSVPYDPLNRIVGNPQSAASYPPVMTPEAKAEYIEELSKGSVPGINSPAFEKGVRKVLSRYFPNLRQLSTVNAPVGADTDLMANLPGGVVVRVQVKCFQDSLGPLGEDTVTQLRKSMELGENGIIVTTNQVSTQAKKAAEEDSERPIHILDGSEFADLLFDNIEQFTAKELWDVGLHRAVFARGHSKE